MTKQPDTDATCSTCGAKSPAENEYCSDGFHAPGKTYWPDTDAIELRMRSFVSATQGNETFMREPTATLILKAADTIADLRNRVEILTEENRQLREIVSNCARALGNGSVIHPDCTVEFMKLLPPEITLHVEKLKALSSSDSRGGV